MIMKKYFTTPIIIAALCALGIHTVLFTDAGHRLQSSIIESDTSSHAQAHLVAKNGSLSLKVNVTADNVTGIVGTILYDDESLVLNKPLAPRWRLEITDAEFTKKFHLTFPTPTNITKWDTILTWDLTALLPAANTINLIDVTLQMADGDQDLSTEGTGEF